MNDIIFKVRKCIEFSNKFMDIQFDLNYCSTSSARQ